MEGMVRDALSLLRPDDGGKPLAPVDINALLAKLREEFAVMGEVTVSGQASQPLHRQGAAAQRCLTNLIANAIKFGAAPMSRSRTPRSLAFGCATPDPDPAPQELERVFEPFDASSPRATATAAAPARPHHRPRHRPGARGTLTLQNHWRGLEALLLLPRRC
jgi:protein-histidine pros-kinase